MLLIKRTPFWLVTPVFGNPVQLSDTKQTRPLLFAKGREMQRDWKRNSRTKASVFRFTSLCAVDKAENESHLVYSSVYNEPHFMMKQLSFLGQSQLYEQFAKL